MEYRCCTQAPVACDRRLPLSPCEQPLLMKENQNKVQNNKRENQMKLKTKTGKKNIMLVTRRKVFFLTIPRKKNDTCPSASCPYTSLEFYLCSNVMMFDAKLHINL